MKFDDLDKKMKVFETLNDQYVLPNVYMVARIDGRGFTKLTKEKHDFARPFDIRFKQMMQETTMHLMNCGFKVIYGYTQSDEISLLFDLQENGFARKIRKYNSVLAGEASAKFSVLLQDVGSFDCRISQLPSKELVVDYFRWRHEDAHRNSLNAHCYWLLRDQGQTAIEATQLINGKSIAYKNELLFENEINFNELPSWQKRGTGFYWEDYEKEGINPINNQKVKSIKRRIKVDEELPLLDDYSEMIRAILADG